MHKFLRPYHLLLAVGLLTAFLSLFCKAETIDVHIHDTYFIVTTKLLFLVPSVLLLFLSLLYAGVSDILLWGKLTWLHVIITIVTIAFMIIIPLWTVFYYGPRLIDFSSFSHFQMQNDMVAAAFLLLIAVQLLFVVNLVGGVISRLAKKRRNFQ